MFVEIIPYLNSLYRIKGIAQVDRNISDGITITIKQIKNLTNENMGLMIEHISLALPCIEKIDETTYKFVYSLDNARALKLRTLQKNTYQRIALQMPDWKLNRLQSYYKLSKKVLTTGIDSLDAIEKAEYDVFPDVNETHEQCQKYVSSVLQWVANCIKAHGEVEQQIMKATDIVGLDTISTKKIEYPKLVVG